MLTRCTGTYTSNSGGVSGSGGGWRRGGGGGGGGSDGAHGSDGDADGDDAGTTKAAAAATTEAGLACPSLGAASTAVASMQAAALVTTAGAKYVCQLDLRAHGKNGRSAACCSRGRRCSCTKRVCGRCTDPVRRRPPRPRLMPACHLARSTSRYYRDTIAPSEVLKIVDFSDVAHHEDDG